MGEIGVYTKALIMYESKVLIIKRSNYTSFGEGEWDIPGGGLKFGESLHDCLNREIKEETGLTVRIDKLLYAVTNVVNPSAQTVGLVYLCHADTNVVTLSHEHTDFIWATQEQLKERVSKPALDVYEENSVFDIFNTD